MDPVSSQQNESETETEPQQQPNTSAASSAPSKKKWWLLLVAAVVLVLAGAAYWWQSKDDTKDTKTNTTTTQKKKSVETPVLATEVVLDGREHIWDIAFLPSKEMLFTERKGTLNIADNEGQTRQVAAIDDVVAVGEGGLMGLVVDPEFAENRFIYICYNAESDIRVVRWKLDDDATGLSDRNAIIIGAPRNESGRHSGCRLAFGPDGYLWVGTGDTAQDLTPQSPQDPKSLGGKILRVTRDGEAAPGNLDGNFDPRIYSYGHRNTQGLAFFEKPVNGVSGISAEHGSFEDDEVNLLKPGNFGWAPPDGSYDENVPMTDKDRFPDAIEAIWSSGNPTLAPSGAAVLTGDQWKAWDGAVVIALLKTQHLRILLLNESLKVTKQEVRFENQFGRLRAVTQGPDGSLYVSTSTGENDKIIRVTPQ
jgi:glucose/arabinose dehydrogenase